MMNLAKIRLRAIGKLFTGAILATLLIIFGWYFGYISGAENQIYFDAVARASLYEKALSSDAEEQENFIRGFLFKQKCLLASGFDFDTFSIHHPSHSDVLEYYESNIDRICGVSGCDCKVK